MKNKKILMSFGTIVSVIMPIATLVSCGNAPVVEKKIEGIGLYHFKSNDFKLITAGKPMISPLYDETVEPFHTEGGSNLGNKDSQNKPDNKPTKHANPYYRFKLHKTAQNDGFTDEENSERIELYSTKYYKIDFTNLKENIKKQEIKNKVKITEIDMSELLNYKKIVGQDLPLYIERDFWDLFPNLEKVFYSTKEGATEKTNTFLINVNAQPFQGNTNVYKGGILRNLPNKLKVIGNHAFSGQKLSSYQIKATQKNSVQKHYEIIIPASVTTIGEYAFAQNRLKFLKIPNTVKEIKEGAFKENIIDDLKLSNSLKYINADLFKNNKIKKLIIPNSIEGIKSEAFKNNELIKLEISKDSKLKYIGSSSFWNNKIKSLSSLPKSLRNIFGNAFKQNLLEVIDLSGTSIKIIKEGSFEDNIPKDKIGKNLVTKLTLPKALSTIEERAFATGHIQDLDLNNYKELTSIGERAFASNLIKEVKLNNKIKILPYEVFSDNLITTLGKGVFKSVTSIGEEAFKGNKITNINLTKFTELSKNIIGDNAFAGNPLKTLTLNNKINAKEFKRIFGMKITQFSATKNIDGKWVFKIKP